MEAGEGREAVHFVNLPSSSLFPSPPAPIEVAARLLLLSPVLSAFVIDCSRPFDALTNDAVVTVLAGDGVGVLLSHVDRVALSVHRTTRAKLASIQIHFGTRPSLLGGFCGEFLLGI